MNVTTNRTLIENLKIILKSLSSRWASFVETWKISLLKSKWVYQWFIYWWQGRLFQSFGECQLNVQGTVKCTGYCKVCRNWVVKFCHPHWKFMSSNITSEITCITVYENALHIWKYSFRICDLKKNSAAANPISACPVWTNSCKDNQKIKQLSSAPCIRSRKQMLASKVCSF